LQRAWFGNSSGRVWASPPPPFGKRTAGLLSSLEDFPPAVAGLLRLCRRACIEYPIAEIGHMPVRRKATEAGIFSASELALLMRVFEQTRMPAETEAEREARASRIIANYMAGIRDEAELASLSRRPLRR
jgi:hypothetical protein